MGGPRRLERLEGGLQFLDATHPVAKESFAKGRVPVEEPLHQAPPRTIVAWPQCFFHEVFQPDVEDTEAGVRIVGVVVFAEIAERLGGERAAMAGIVPGVAS